MSTDHGNEAYEREEEETATEEGMALLPGRDDANEPYDEESED
ncbi:hypothetical protein [Flexivirga alba]|uniref:Uncharacterized protein n=1 Tax=Flexivirga alba TaxID=702742 RepID=A0ABW2AH01_9MICO